MKPPSHILTLFLIVVGVFAFCVLPAAAQKSSPCQNMPGVALVIGNSNYQYIPTLKSPVYDAEDMAAALRGFGFCVLDVRKDASQSEMEAAVTEFEHELKVNKKVGIFYFSGHGVQSKGSNYLIPVEADIPSELFLKNKALDLDSVLEAMEDNELNIAILDACRNNPFEKSWKYKGGSGAKGLATVGAPTGTLIAYATAPGRVALDGNTRNSSYTRILLNEMKKKSVNVLQMFSNVRSVLSRETNKAQVPWEANSIIGDYCLGGCGGSNNTGSQAASIPTTPRGPGNVARGPYITNKNKIPVQVKTLVNAASNQEEWIKTTVFALMAKSGEGHAWDNQWYYETVREQDKGLILAWQNLNTKESGWLFLQRTRSTWFYKTNFSAEWHSLTRGGEKKIAWDLNGDKVKIVVKPPTLVNGWKEDQLMYKFSY